MKDVFKINFPKHKDAEFVKELKLRVNNYFQDKGISRHANFTIVTKTIAMFAILYVPYALMLSGIMANFWLVLLCWIVMGLGVAGIGMSVMEISHRSKHFGVRQSHYRKARRR